MATISITRIGEAVISPATALRRHFRAKKAIAEHYDFIWRLLRRLGVDASNADDAAQEVFIVFAKRQGDVAPEKERSFLYGVAMRVAQTSRRSRSRRPEVTGDDIIASVADDATSVDDRLDARRTLERVLDTMPIDVRSVFVLYEVFGMTMKEIAEMSELPEGTVASRLRRGRALFEEAVARGKSCVSPATGGQL